jgi:hypothetical protein
MARREMMALRGRVRGFVLNDHAVPGKVVLFMSGIKVVFRNGQQSEMQKNLE